MKDLSETSIKVHDLENRELNLSEIVAFDSDNESDLISELSDGSLWDNPVSGSGLDSDSDSDVGSDFDSGSEIGT